VSDQQIGQPQGTEPPSTSAKSNGSVPPSCAPKMSVREHEQPSTPKSAKIEQDRPLSVHKATGPRTPQGKQRSKFNALKHGLQSKAVLLQDESRAEYGSLLTGLREDLQPQGKLEAVLVENLAALLWRKRRLIQVESAEISKNDFLRGDSLEPEDIQQLDCTQQDGASVEEPSDSRGLKYIPKAMRVLINYRIALEDDSLDEKEKLRIHEEIVDLEKRHATDRRIIQKVAELLHLSKALPKSEERADDPDQSKKEIYRLLDAQLERFMSSYNILLDKVARRTMYSMLAPRIPSQEVLDHLLRYEAHLSREFDRTMTQLERLQRMRKGQPVAPQIDVNLTS
jgi:hypothetical protein